ncbi:hypothetical protein LCGC14_0541950 [marine sediment metagenome]|uniref:Helix-turn-helix domain-containing protein n=1 Tax=marine sediment metagenome TaxID=412755 RepID=A0A0F9V0V0_9ZZZZ
MDISVKIKPLDIGGKKYFTVNQMSALTNKSSQTIYSLINLGNAVRKMQSIKIADRVLIPIEELIEFPFTYAGAHPQDNIYHYDENGKIIKKEERIE